MQVIATGPGYDEPDFANFVACAAATGPEESMYPRYTTELIKHSGASLVARATTSGSRR
ncbi:hypothetical protein B0G38_002980 [Arthrobacter sp. VKM Ac-2550]|nr:hypothetical protein [Arthrobacter sp. VKM Ac-2550]